MPTRIGFKACWERGRSDTHKLLGWRSIQVLLAAAILLLTLALYVRLRSEQSAIDQIVWSLTYVAVICLVYLLLFMINLLASPWRLLRESLDSATGQLAATRNREAYFRRELESALERESSPPATRKLQNVPSVLKVASAEWHAQNPGIQKEVERLRTENEKLRKLIGDIPDS